MKRTGMSFALAGAAFVLQACATTPAVSYLHIADPDHLFAAADWTTDLDAAVKAAGWEQRIPDIRAHMDEKGGWPEKMKDGDARWFGKDMIAKYNVLEIARLSFYGQPAMLLQVPAIANGHMPDGWKPTTDFYLVMATGAFTPPAAAPN
jgi:hypothetical protein